MSVVVLATLRRTDRWDVAFHATARRTPPSVHPMVPVGDLVVERGESLDPQRFPDHHFRYLGLEHVAPACGDLVGDARRYGRNVRSRSKVFRVGDILFGRLRPGLNKVYLAPSQLGDGICSGEFHVLVPNTDRVDPVFLRAVLSSEYVTRHTPTLQTGSALPRLALADLLAVDVPVAPLVIQRRIADLTEKAARDRRCWRAGLEHAYGRVQDAILTALRDSRPLPGYAECAQPNDVGVTPAPGLPAAYDRGRAAGP